MKRLFVVGCPRSGNTWTAMLLGQHPDIAVAQHVAIFQAIEGLARWFKASQDFGKNVMVSSAPEADGSTSISSLGDSKFSGLLTEDEFTELCRVVANSVLDKIAQMNPGAKVSLEKTPENVRFAELILRVYPDAYFLNVVRDPRAVVASMRGARESWAKDAGFPMTPSGGARFWRGDVERGRAIKALTPNYREVRYETLHERGAEELGEIFRWLGINDDANICEQAIAGASIKNLRKTKAAPTGFFRKGEKEGWRDDLSPADVRIVEYLSRDLMEELGYELSQPDATKKPLRLSVRDWLQWKVRGRTQQVMALVDR